MAKRKYQYSTEADIYIYKLPISKWSIRITSMVFFFIGSYLFYHGQQRVGFSLILVAIILELIFSILGANRKPHLIISPQGITMNQAEIIHWTAITGIEFNFTSTSIEYAEFKLRLNSDHQSNEKQIDIHYLEHEPLVIKEIIESYYSKYRNPKRH